MNRFVKYSIFSVFIWFLVVSLRDGFGPSVFKMGRRPARCYRYIGNKPYPKSRFCRGVPDPRIIRYETGDRLAHSKVLPLCARLILLEHECVSAEALEAARVSSNRYMMKTMGTDGYHIRLHLHP